MLAKLHPKCFFQLLDDIDSDSPSHSLNRAAALRRTFTVLFTVCMCLLVIHYVKMHSTFQQVLLFISHWTEQPNYAADVLTSQYGQLWAYGWWTLWHLVGYVLIPCLIIRLYWGNAIANFGLKLNDSAKHWRGYLLLLSPILLFVGIASQGETFVNHYPFYRLAGRSWFDLVTWEFLYLSQFVFLEFFFRGFMLQALRPAIGANAIWVMCVPYLMIHFPKPWPEAFGAILFGFFLGILALRSRSIWGGVIVHAGVALSMDLAALVAKGQWPTSWWP